MVTIMNGTMDIASKQALKDLHLKLVSDLQVDEVIDYLFSRSILKDDDVENIENQGTSRAKNSKFLKILPKKGPKAFDEFTTALRKNDLSPWLADELESTKQKIQEKTYFKEDLKLEKKLCRSGIPPCLQHYVERPAELKKVQAAFSQLKNKSGWVFIHGMAGSGKSILAAEAVRKVIKDFDGGLFWVSVGQVDESSLLTKMQNLCEKLDKSFRDHKADNVETATERLRELFNSDFLNALIVLDDVWDSSVIKAFNIGSTVLITLRDLKLIPVNYCHVETVNISSGLLLEESKQLLADWIKSDINVLPEEASKIHTECKGNPMVLSIIGSMLSETKDKNAWRCYLRNMRKRPSNDTASMTDFMVAFDQTIKLSIQKLTEVQLYYFKTLSVFMDDVNVPREVLCVFWDKELHEVDAIMSEFVKKSLVRKEWCNYPESETHVYTVHDLILDYLKKNFESDIKDMHEKLIQGYEKLCKGQWHRLPKDNYIHWFLGLHLYRSKQLETLTDVFLNLEFIMNKLEVTGPSDLLYDLRKYKDVFDKQHNKERKEVEFFIRRNAHLLSDRNCDVVQLALCQPENSHVYKQAKRIALSQPKLYFDWCTKNTVRSSCIMSSKLHRGPVFSAVFLPAATKVISCGADKVIRIWDTISGKEVLKFTGHDDDIKACSLSGDGSRLATCSLDGKVIVWSIDVISLDNQNGIASANDSPVTPLFTPRQTSFYNLFTPSGEDFTKDLIIFKAQEFSAATCCAISSDGKEVLVGYENCQAKSYNVESGKSQHIYAHSSSLIDCSYSPDNSKILTASCTEMKLWNTKTGINIATIAEPNDSIFSCCFSPDGSQFLAAVGYQVRIWNSFTQKEIKTYLEPKKELIRCLSLSPDSKLLAVGTTGSSVIIWCCQTDKIIAYHKGHKEWIHSVSFSNADKLLSTSDDGTVMIWNSSIGANSEDVGYKMPFCAQFEGEDSVVSLADFNNRIQIYFNGEKKRINFEEESPLSITCCSLFWKDTEKKIACGFENGSVKIFNLKDQKEPTEYIGHSSAISNCMFSEGGQKLITSSDTTIGIYENGSFRKLLGHQKEVNKIKMLGDFYLISCSKDGLLMAWNLCSSTIKFICFGHKEEILSFDISSDSELIASACADKTVGLWNSMDGSQKAMLHHDDCVRCCRFSSDDNLLISGDDKGIVKIWNLESNLQSPQLFWQFSIQSSWIRDIGISQNSKHLVIASSSLQWWDIETRQHLQTFPIYGRCVERISSSSDFTKFITVDDSGILYILKMIS